MASLEKIVLNALNFNDEVKLSMEALNFIPAQAKAKLSENPNADGVVLVEEPQYTPSYFEIQLRIVNAKTNIDEALTTVGEVMDALTACARTEGGSEIEWTPAESTRTYEAYAILGELLEVPITPTGDLAGWFVKFPILKIKLTCRPFLFTEERVVLNIVESVEQFQTVYVKGILGDVPAEARVVVTDKATQARRYLEVGQDVVESETNASIRIKGESMVLTGFTGSSTTFAGSVSTNVVSTTLLPPRSTICSTGSIANIGTYRVKLRVRATQIKSFLRMGYKVGDGASTYRKWVEVPSLSEWMELDMGEVFLDAVSRGEQVSQIVVQGYSGGANSFVLIDTLSLMPARRYSVAHGEIDTAPSTTSAYDKFKQFAGALAGKAAEIGGTWSGAGDADDFVVNFTFHNAERSAVSDAVGVPRYEICGTTTYDNIAVRLELYTGNTQYDEALKIGTFVRYVDTNNWLAFVVQRFKSEIGAGESAGFYYTSLYKKVAGTTTLITGSEVQLGNIKTGLPINAGLYLIVLSNGEWRVGASTVSIPSTTLAGVDAVLSSTGALKTGKIGMFDEKNGATAEQRLYPRFEAYVPLFTQVCNSGKAAEVGTDGAQLENTTGKYWSPVPVHRGSDLYLDPAGPDGLINRLAVKMRRGDTRIEPDTITNDKQAIEVLARERFLTPR